MEAFHSATVESVMVRHPVTHEPDLTVSEARSALLDPHRHLLLLVRGGVLVGTVAREDLTYLEDEAVPALEVFRSTGRTVSSGACLACTLARMQTASARRLAVVDAGRHLMGLLCLKASGTGFCSDTGIAARARSQSSRVYPLSRPALDRTGYR